MKRFPKQIVRFVGDKTQVEPGRQWPIAFVHINKTAGTTFSEFLRSNFGSRAIIAPPFYGEFEKIGIRDDRTELFWGHFTYSMFSAQRSQAWFITFLRDPIERVISQYRSLHNPKNLSGGWDEVLPDEARTAMRFAQEATFEEFIHSEDAFIRGHIVDLQTLFLSSHSDPAHPDYLSSAMDNIERHFLFVGITERFEDAIDLFRFQLQSSVRYRAAVHQKNISERYPIEMTERVRARLNEVTRNDQLLYRHAVALFDRRVRRLRDTLGIGRPPCAA